MKTLKQIIEAAKLDNGKAVLKLLEDEGMAPMEAAPAAPEAAGDWRGKLCEAICHIVQDAELDPSQVKAKVNAILKMVMDEEKKDEPAAETKDEPAADKGDEPTETKESRELATYRKQAAVRTLCESLKFSPTEAQIGILAKLEDAERKTLIETFKGSKATAPRSQGTTRTLESAEAPADDAAWLKRLTTTRR